MNKTNYDKACEQELSKEGTNQKTLLLHACCAPCSSAVLDRLQDKIKIVVYYYNPNIVDETEYRHRADELQRLVRHMNSEAEAKQCSEDGVASAKAEAKQCDGEGVANAKPDCRSRIGDIEVVLGPHDTESFLEIAKGLENVPEGGERCEKCFRLRLKAACEYAASIKADYVTTTLTISPLKDAQLLNRIGEEAAAGCGVAWLPSDFKKRDGYKHSIELSKKYDLYRQNYCGCPFSKRETEQRQPKPANEE